jgi:hypothetical protein
MFGGRPSMHTACIVIQNVLGWVSACSLGLVCIGVLVAQGRAPAYALPAALVSGAVVATGLGLHLGLRRYRWLLLLMLRRLARRRWFALRRAARRFIDALLVFERANARFVPRGARRERPRRSFPPRLSWRSGSPSASICRCRCGAPSCPCSPCSGCCRSRFRGFGGAQAVHVFLLAPIRSSGTASFLPSQRLYAVLNILLNVVLGAVAWMLGSNEITKRAMATDAGADR